MGLNFSDAALCVYHVFGGEFILLGVAEEPRAGGTGEGQDTLDYPPHVWLNPGHDFVLKVPPAA